MTIARPEVARLQIQGDAEHDEKERAGDSRLTDGIENDLDFVERGLSHQPRAAGSIIG